MRVLTMLLVLLLSPAITPCAERAEIEVVPGGVVLWQAATGDRCGPAASGWPALDEVCWYPIDLLQPEGELVLERVRAGSVEHLTVKVAPYPYPVQELTVDRKMVELSDEDLARVEGENERIAALWDRSGPVRFTLPIGAPLVDPPKAKNFGSRRIFNGEPRSPHSGVDYSAPRGEEVLSVAAGTVVLVAQHFFAGNSVYVDHGDGLISMYFHLDAFAVSEGQVVGRGEVLGTVGSTGRATGPHLHFGLRWHGAKIDPSALMERVEAIPMITTASRSLDPT